MSVTKMIDDLNFEDKVITLDIFVIFVIFVILMFFCNIYVIIIDVL